MKSCLQRDGNRQTNQFGPSFSACSRFCASYSSAALMQRAGAPAQTVWGAILNHHGVRADNATIADGDGTQNFRPRRDVDVVPDAGNLVVARLPADGHIRANYTILANDGALVHDDADTLVAEHRALANLGARWDERVVRLVDTQLIEARQGLKGRDHRASAHADTCLWR